MTNTENVSPTCGPRRRFSGAEPARALCPGVECASKKGAVLPREVLARSQTVPFACLAFPRLRQPACTVKSVTVKTFFFSFMRHGTQ